MKRKLIYFSKIWSTMMNSSSIAFDVSHLLKLPGSSRIDSKFVELIGKYHFDHINDGITKDLFNPHTITNYNTFAFLLKSLGPWVILDDAHHYFHYYTIIGDVRIMQIFDDMFSKLMLANFKCCGHTLTEIVQQMMTSDNISITEVYPTAYPTNWSLLCIQRKYQKVSKSLSDPKFIRLSSEIEVYQVIGYQSIQREVFKM